MKISNVVDVDFKRAPGTDGLHIKRRGTGECRHAKRHDVDPVLRRVTCRDCKATLDPVEAMLMWARDADVLRDQAEQLQRSVDTLRVEEKEARRLHRNAVAALRREGIESPAVVVREVRSLREALARKDSPK